MPRRDRTDHTRRRRADRPASHDASPAEDDAARAPAPLSDGAALDGPDHAWWSQRELAAAWSPQPADDHALDPLQVHLGRDWQHDFGFDDPAAPPPPDLTRPAMTAPPAPPEATAYAVLGIDPSASWEQIVAAHRRAVRHNHPDRVAADGHDPGERARAEESIIAINAAFGELRTRRGR